MSTGALDCARQAIERLPAGQPETASKVFELADRYLAANKEGEAVALLQKVQKKMSAAHRDNDFAARLDALVEAHAASLPLAEFWASVYAQLNRETKYFDALVRLFDLYIAGKNVQRACDTFEKLVDIDSYDARNQKRFSQLEAQADAAFLSRIRNRLGQVATYGPETQAPAAQSVSLPTEQQSGQPSLEDLMVQAEIFLQYSLQPKALERLQRIAELFPGEERHNDRLRKLYQLANWWPEGTRRAASDRRRSRPGSASDRFRRYHARFGQDFGDQPLPVSAAFGAGHSFRRNQ